VPVNVRRLARRVRLSFSRDPIARDAGRFELLAGLSQRLGYRLYNHRLHWPTDAEYLAASRGFPFRVADGVDIKDRKYVLWSIARSVADLDGDTAECGAYHGGSSYLICRSRRPDDASRHHVFDSFAGVSEPSVEDEPDDPTARPWRRGDLATDMGPIERALARFDFVEYHVGWIPDRFPDVAGSRFRLVHVDVDLYEPTRDAVEFFFPRLVPGGVLLCDDYGSTRCPGAKKAMDDYAGSIGRTVVHLTTGQGLLVQR
jgi:hypothetical protein